MSSHRRIAAGLIVLALASSALVVFDVGGPIRGAVSLLFLLVAPGLALSLSMGPMSIVARMLVALAGSAAMVTITSLVLVVGGFWSASLGLVLLAGAVIALTLPVLRSRSSSTPTAEAPTADALTPDNPTPDRPTPDLQQESARRTR